VHGEALAYNCIGVDFIKLGASKPSHYNQIGDHEKSSINHQFALRYAIQMSSVAGQSVAIGNLGKVGGGQVYA